MVLWQHTLEVVNKSWSIPKIYKITCRVDWESVWAVSPSWAPENVPVWPHNSTPEALARVHDTALIRTKRTQPQVHIHDRNPKPSKSTSPWSGPSRRRRGRPGTCSYRTWRGRHSWSRIHSWGRGAETHTYTAVGSFSKHDICFLFAFKWDSLPLLEGSPAKQESILPLKDQQPGFRGQRTCSHSRLHSLPIYRRLLGVTLEKRSPLSISRCDSL